MVFLDSIEQLLAHIKNVEEDTMSLSKDSLLKLSSFLERNSIEIDDDVAQALQYQDIISQQLSASIEAIEAIQKSIHQFKFAYKEDESIALESMSLLQKKLGNILERAKDNRRAFSGNIDHNSDDEIEFF